ncbi:MAG: glycosyl hydrolase family 28 protein [Bacteroidota bacterium]|nr:glycosyl hydrolase family 28 protein [Bacteroidota bacterium]
MKGILLLVTMCVLGQHNVYCQKKYNIKDFGAIADGKTLNTEKIQAAIDKASSAGGGQVVVPEGKFLTGTIILKSGVDLYLSPKAVLLGSTSPYDYPFMKEVLVKGSSKDAESIGALIGAKSADHISITGQGTIDGQGRKLALNIDSLFYVGQLDTMYYNLRRKRPGRRPGDIKFESCENVTVSGVTIKNAAGWVQTYDLCKNLTIDHIRVESDAYWNNDGMDIVDCSNVRITHCFVNAADDGICLKSEHAGHLNDGVYIDDCTVRSSASAVKFGTASTGGFKNIVIKNIRVFDTFRSAIAIESVDGGILENVLVDSIFATNTGNPIFIRLGHRNVDGPVGTLKNIVIKNITVEVPFGRPDANYDLRGPDLDFFHNPFPSSIVGLPGHPVENVVLENIRISYPGNGNDGLAFLPLFRLATVPENEKGYPEFSMFGELPAWGFYVRHVSGLTMKNISITARAKDYRPGCVFDDVNGLTLDQWKVREDGDAGQQYILKDVTNTHLNVDETLVKTIH